MTAPLSLSGLARPRRMSQRGRAALLWALALYVVAQLGMLAVMNRWHPTLYDAVYRFKWQALSRRATRAPDRPLLVMVGSSRTQMGLQAKQLEGLRAPDGQPFLAYNFGVPTAGPFREWLHLSDMLDAGIRPRLLLVEFPTPLLNHPRKDNASEENWASAPWMSARQLVRLWPYFARPDRMGSGWLSARLAPCYVFRSQLHAALLEKWQLGEVQPVSPPHDPWGWQLPKPLGPQARMALLGNTYVLFHSSLQNYRLGEGSARALRDLLERCRRENVPVALVVMPESRTFRSWYSPEGRAAPRRLLAELQAAGTRVIDASEWVADEDFVDGQHLLAEGSKVFTTRLRAELQRILAEGGPELASRARRD